MFKHGMTLTPQAQIRPCCSFMYSPDWYLDDGKWENDWETLEHKNNEDWIDYCVECKDTEALGNKKSLRQIANERISDNATGRAFWDIKLHNTCNLMCRMCGPHSSSTWQQNIKANPSTMWGSTWNKQAYQKYGWHKDYLEAIKPYVLDAEILKFTGGEPFMIPHVKSLIKHVVKNGDPSNMRLQITTNGTYQLDNEWMSLFDRFSFVSFTLSVDAVGDRYNYIRAGSDFDTVNRNVCAYYSKYDHHVYAVHQTLNASNIDQLKSWVDDIKSTLTLSVELFKPEFLSFSSLNPELRSRYNVNARSEYKHEDFVKLCEYMEAIDKIYNTDFKTACPEFFE
jgi:organic radical activating enzyme